MKTGIMTMLMVLAAVLTLSIAYAEGADQEEEGVTVGEVMKDVVGTENPGAAESVKVSGELYEIMDKYNLVKEGKENNISLIVLIVVSVAGVIGNLFEAKRLPKQFRWLGKIVNIIGLSISERAGR